MRTVYTSTSRPQWAHYPYQHGYGYWMNTLSTPTQADFNEHTTNIDRTTRRPQWEHYLHQHRCTSLKTPPTSTEQANLTVNTTHINTTTSRHQHRCTSLKTPPTSTEQQADLIVNITHITRTTVKHISTPIQVYFVESTTHTNTCIPHWTHCPHQHRYTSLIV